MDNVEKYLNEAKKYELTGTEDAVAREIMNWSNSLKFVADIVKKGEFDNAVKIVEQVGKVVSKDLLKMVKGLQKGQPVSRPGFIDQKIGKKSTYQR